MDASVGRDLLDIVRRHEPAVPEPWRPAPEPPPDLEIAGPWYWGPTALAVRFRGADRLQIVPLGASGRAATFVRDGARWVGLDGYYAGEALEVRRGGDGTVTHLSVATFVLTRAPYEPGDLQPGGVELPGWRPLG
jgi:D-alanyl-D-alanine carboxypeptidase